MLSGSRTAKAYLLALSTAFLLAAPWFAPAGGYGGITLFKAAAYLLLTGIFLLASLPDLPKVKGFFRSPERLLALGYLFFCLLSALCSPWKRSAFLGGSRREGFLHIALYVLSFLTLSCRRIPRRGMICAFAAALLVQDGICLLQLGGVNALGLYPPGLGWADAGLCYTGSYLGTLGNAGQTGAVLAAASAFLYLSILERGGRFFLLLPTLICNAFILAAMDVTGPMLALCLVMPAALIPYGRTLGGLFRWGGLTLLLLAVLLWQVLGAGIALTLTLYGGALFLLERLLPGQSDVRRLSCILLGGICVLGFTLVFTYRGWYAPLREAAALLHGETGDAMGNGRLYIWRQVLGAVPGHLWLGTGPDTLGLRDLLPYRYADPVSGQTVTLAIDAAHCEVLQTLACCGLPAALCHLGLWLCAAAGFFRRQGGGRICAGAALCYALQGFFGISMCASAPVFWVFLALSIAPSIKEGGADPEPDE